MSSNLPEQQTFLFLLIFSLINSISLVLTYHEVSNVIEIYNPVAMWLFKVFVLLMFELKMINLPSAGWIGMVPWVYLSIYPHSNQDWLCVGVLYALPQKSGILKIAKCRFGKVMDVYICVGGCLG